GKVNVSTCTVKMRPSYTLRMSRGTIGLFVTVGPPGKIVQHRFQVLRQRRNELQTTPLARVRKGEPRCVQERALEALPRANVARHASMDAAVERVAHDRVADGAQMHADLMRPSCMNRHLTEREAWQMMRTGDPRHRFTRMLRARRHLLPVRRVPAYRRVDAAAGLD